MNRPLNRHHPKRFTSPTFDFAHKRRPPDDSAAVRAEKERLVAEHLAKRGASKAPGRKASDV